MWQRKHLSNKCFILCSIHTRFPLSAILLEFDVVLCLTLGSVRCYVLWMQSKWNLLLFFNFIFIFSCKVGESELHRSLIRPRVLSEKSQKCPLTSAAAWRNIPYSWDGDLSGLSPLSCTRSDLLVTERWAAGWGFAICAQATHDHTPSAFVLHRPQMCCFLGGAMSDIVFWQPGAN